MFMYHIIVRDKLFYEVNNPTEFDIQLNNGIDRTHTKGLFTQLKPGKPDEDISYLLYLNDCVFIQNSINKDQTSEAGPGSDKYLRCTLLLLLWLMSICHQAAPADIMLQLTLPDQTARG